MTPVPRLACIVLAHGPDASVDGAVASIQGDVELVVVHSGGPPPPTDARLVHEARLLMPGAARNRGIAATSAPFVAFLAADCRALPGWVEGRAREHEAGADLVADVLERPSSIPERAAWLTLHRRRAAATPAQQRLPYGLSYRRELLEPFNEDVRQGEDTQLNKRLLARGARIAYPTDVRIAHAYPATVKGVLRDAYVRGGRRAAAEDNGINVLREALHLIDDAPRLERDPRVLALAALSTTVYAAGVIRASRDRGATAEAPAPSRR